MIYLDYAATSPMTKKAWKAYRKTCWGNASTLYTLGRKAKKELEEARKRIAKCIGAKSEEIYFTSGGTESDNWAIKILLENCEGRIGVSKIEHPAIFESCKKIDKIEFLDVDKTGQIKTVRGLDGLSVILLNNEIGTIQEPIWKERVKFVHCDGVQALGNIEINVKEMDIDLLSGSSHKFGGPKGVGFLYVKSGLEINSLIYGGGQEKGFRSGTENVPGIVAMSVALEEACKHIKKKRKKKRKLREYFLDGLVGLGWDFKVNGTGEGILSVSFKGMDAQGLLFELDKKGICCSAGSACHSTSVEISKVLKAIGLSDEYARGTLRFSFTEKTKKKEIDYVLKCLKKIIEDNRKYMTNWDEEVKKAFG